jgi:hypothetical protein
LVSDFPAGERKIANLFLQCNALLLNTLEAEVCEPQNKFISQTLSDLKSVKINRRDIHIMNFPVLGQFYPLNKVNDKMFSGHKCTIEVIQRRLKLRP